MKRILGLDLGTNSIGWAMLDSDSNKIIDYGVKVFSNQRRDSRRNRHLLNGRIRRLDYLYYRFNQNVVWDYFAYGCDKLYQWLTLQLDCNKRKVTLSLTVFMFIFGFTFSKQWQFWINIGFGGLFIFLNMDKDKIKKNKQT